MGFDANVWKHRKKYHKPPKGRSWYDNDHNQAVKEMEEFMIEHCEKHKINWSTVNKYELAKQIGPRFYKEYFDALLSRRVNR